MNFSYHDLHESTGASVFTCVIDETSYEEMDNFLVRLRESFGEPSITTYNVFVEDWFSKFGRIDYKTKLITIESYNTDVSVFVRLSVC